MRISFHLVPRFHIYDNWQMLRESIARLGIFLLVKDRLQLVCWRRLHIISITLLYRNTLANKEMATIRTPLYAVAVIHTDGSILRQDTLYGII